MLRNNTREELLIFLTPRVVEGGGAGLAALPTAQQLWEHRNEPAVEQKEWKK
jgi:hypothetical protein